MPQLTCKTKDIQAALIQARSRKAILPGLPGEQAQLLAAAQQLLQVQAPRQLDAVAQHAVKVQVRLRMHQCISGVNGLVPETQQGILESMYLYLIDPVRWYHMQKRPFGLNQLAIEVPLSSPADLLDNRAAAYVETTHASRKLPHTGCRQSNSSWAYGLREACNFVNNDSQGTSMMARRCRPSTPAAR